MTMCCQRGGFLSLPISQMNSGNAFPSLSTRRGHLSPHIEGHAAGILATWQATCFGSEGRLKRRRSSCRARVVSMLFTNIILVLASPLPTLLPAAVCNPEEYILPLFLRVVQLPSWWREALHQRATWTSAQLGGLPSPLSLPQVELSSVQGCNLCHPPSSPSLALKTSYLLHCIRCMLMKWRLCVWSGRISVLLYVFMFGMFTCMWDGGVIHSGSWVSSLLGTLFLPARRASSGSTRCQAPRRCCCSG